MVVEANTPYLHSRAVPISVRSCVVILPSTLVTRLSYVEQSHYRDLEFCSCERKGDLRAVQLAVKRQFGQMPFKDPLYAPEQDT